MGHVDTGKTKILDYIRRTNVQANEAGGITQQIGASFFPQYKLVEELSRLNPEALKVKCEIPGLLVIDTPGHEAFVNLRSRGSSLCDLAIVVIDIMHGLENQTIESLKMLQEKQTPFVIALNKIDRIQSYNSVKDFSSYTNLKKQESFARTNFQEKFNFILGQLAQQNINAKFYWEMTPQDFLERDWVPVVPTSALKGEGMPDLLGNITYFAQTVIPDKITRRDHEFKATVLEVKKMEGMSATIDVILVNGVLKVDDKIILSGFDGPIETHIKNLLTPHPMKEMRVKNEHMLHKVVYGAMGVRIVATGLEKAIAGSSIFRVDADDQVEGFKDLLSADIAKVKKTVKTKKDGVGVAASTLGALEALLIFLRKEHIQVSNVFIGDISKTDMQKVLTSYMSEEIKFKQREYLSLLCFEVKVLPDAAKFADEHGIKIMKAEIIYHLADQFKVYQRQQADLRKKLEGKKAVFPV